MNLKLGFCFYGIIIFALPMLINIISCIFPPEMTDNCGQKAFPMLEATEQVTRILFLLVICIFKSADTINFASPFLYISLIFLMLYYVVWIRYFAGGRNIKLLGKSFLFVPQPLAVFPVLYFIFAALWVGNLPAVFIMLIFGTAHNVNTYKKFKSDK